MQRALSNQNPKTVWQVIHSILNPQPLRQNPDDLNPYFANTANRTFDPTNKTTEELYALIASLPVCGNNSCHLRSVTYQEVLNEITSLRSDCSTAHDQIPVKFIKLVAEEIATPLTHIFSLTAVLRKNIFLCRRKLPVSSLFLKPITLQRITTCAEYLFYLPCLKSMRNWF